MSSEASFSNGMYPPEGTVSAVRSDACVVQLRYATLPHVLRAVAVHYWFVVFESASRRWHRWEVWQTKNAGGRSIGHIHCDMRHPDCGVGGGAYRLAAEWDGRAAQRIRAVLARVSDYPHWDHYRAWPGPNSNTFTAWVLREAGLPCCLDPRAVGKDYVGLLGARCSRGPFCAQLETPLCGVRVSLHGGVEVHLLGLTCGLRWSPFEVHTPFGRVSLGQEGRRRL